VYEYQFIAIQSEWGFSGNHLHEHQSLIHEQAEKGWRFVTFIPTKITQGVPVHADLVFERKTQ